MRNIVFSVVVPIYNLENYISKCIDSILNQTFKQYELILVDDGSIDKSRDICDMYASRNPNIVLIHEDNKGVVSARIVGTNVARGEYIVFIDGDDWIEPDYLSVFYSAIEKYKTDIVCCGYICSQVAIPVNSREGLYNRHNIESEIFPFLLQSKTGEYFRPSLWAKAIKKELVLSNQISNVSLNLGEDRACIVPCIFHANSMYIDCKCLYHYRKNETSITKSRKEFSWDFPQIIAEHIINQMDVNSFDFKEQLDRKICHDVFTVVISCCFQNHPYRKIKARIITELSNSRYSDSIAHAYFSSYKAKLMKLTLERHWILPIWLYSKFKHF